MTTKEIAFKETALQEAGWYAGDQPRDPNPTLQGVTQKRYDTYRLSQALSLRSVHEMSPEERDSIYNDYWTGAQCDAFGPLTAPLVFDHAFNAGIVAATRLAQRALGLVDDGKFGPKTLAALKVADDDELALKVVIERLIAYDEISDHPNQRPNLKAWVGRLTDYSRKYLRLP